MASSFADRLFLLLLTVHLIQGDLFLSCLHYLSLGATVPSRGHLLSFLIHVVSEHTGSDQH